jgi:nucleoside-diphosphate-sugar epimerase
VARLQTILGAGGVIGVEVARSLARTGDRIRLVSRNPRPVNPGDETMSADLTDSAGVARAVSGSSIVYLTAGFPYRTVTWRAVWPAVMRNVIDACRLHGARLVFFDNVYMYGRVRGPMTEATPVNPCSKKGEVRAEIAGMLLDAVAKGDLQALIARSADFYGPGAVSFATATVVPNFRQKKRALWFCNDRVKHSLTYAPDAARATALLGSTESAYGRVWHLPTDRDALTGRQYLAMCAAAFGARPDYTVLSPWMVRMAGLFDPIARESIEMLYQYEQEYLFDSTDFEQSFPFKTTRYAEGIKAMAAAAG